MSLAIAAAKPQGDPGLFGFLGKAVGTLTGVATSFIPGPAGAIARGLQRKVFGGGGQPAMRPSVMPVPQPRQIGSVMNGAYRPDVPRGRGLGGFAQAQQPVPAQIQMPTNGVGVDATPAIGCPKGYKPNKSGYYRRIKSPGNPEGSVFYIHPESRCVKIRRRNPANPRAADRALGRIKSAKRFASKMGAVTIRDTCRHAHAHRKK